MDEDRRRWLATLVDACERVLAADQGDLTDPTYAAVRNDVAELLARIRAELAELEGST